MTLDELIRAEDALNCMWSMTKTQFLACIKQTPEIQRINSEAWENAERLVARHGTRRKALNYVARSIEACR